MNTATTVSMLPWWWIPAVTAGATLVGALIAATVSWRSDKRKFKADDRRQWDKEIRDLYLDVAEEMKKWDNLHLDGVFMNQEEMKRSHAGLANSFTAIPSGNAGKITTCRVSGD